MQIFRLDPTTAPSITGQGSEDERKKPRVQLHASSSFERGASHLDLSALKSGNATGADASEQQPKSFIHVMADGTELEVRTPMAEARARVAALRAGLSPDRRPAFDAQCSAMGQALQDELTSNPTGITTGSMSAGFTASAQQTYEVALLTTGQRAHEEAVTDSLYMGISGMEANIRKVIESHEAERQMGDEVRVDAAELRELLGAWPEDGSAQTFTFRTVVTNPDGTKTLVEQTVTLTKEEAMALLKELDRQVESLGSFGTVEAAMLQQMVNVYNQAMNTLSNTMKGYEDNLKGIINNVKAS